MKRVAGLARAACIAVLVGYASSLLAAEAVPTEQDPATNARAVALSQQLRCLVCQNQTIADSSAELAVDLRRQVREQIAAGRTDSEILAYMTDRYSDFVLYMPPFKPTTLLLWLGPFVLLGAGAVTWFLVLRGRRKEAAGGEPSAAAVARARELLDQGD